MLILTRKTNESVIVGDAVIHIFEASCGRVRIGIEAPKSINILRSELLNGREQTVKVLPRDGSSKRRS